MCGKKTHTIEKVQVKKKNQENVCVFFPHIVHGISQTDNLYHMLESVFSTFRIRCPKINPLRNFWTSAISLFSLCFGMFFYQCVDMPKLRMDPQVRLFAAHGMVFEKAGNFRISKKKNTDSTWGKHVSFF